jgi:uncharacterized damage-inducible protein DinB
MSEIQRILDQHHGALHGPAWHGDSVWQILEGVTPEQAQLCPLSKTHTIWELVAHMTFWETEVRHRLQKLEPQSEAELNFPRMPTATAENWARQLDAFRESNGKFRDAVKNLDDSQLETPLSSAQNTIYVELHGVIQHHLYHAGQIAILRKNSG